MRGGDRPRGPCCLCGIKSSCSWRWLPKSAGSKAGQSSCNACYVSVCKQAKEDPDSMEERLAARCALGEVPGPQRRRRMASQLVHTRSSQDQCSQPSQSGSQAQPPVQQHGTGDYSHGSGSDGAGSGSNNRYIPSSLVQRQEGEVAPLPQPQSPLQVQQQQRQQQSEIEPAALAQELPLQSAVPLHLPLQSAVPPLPPPPPPLPLPPAQQPHQLPWLHVQGPAAPQQQGVGDGAKQAAEQAWLGARLLPGQHPELLGHLPALWLLPPGPGAAVRLVGALLIGVQLPPPGLSFGLHQALLMTGQGLQPALRLAVYCCLTGQLLHCRDWVRQEECALELHPRHRVLAWDSSEGWQLLFPQAATHTAQTLLFTDTVHRYGCAAVEVPSGLASAQVAPQVAIAAQPPQRAAAPALLPPLACLPWQRAGSACSTPTANHCLSGVVHSCTDYVPLEDAVRALGIHLTDADLRSLRCGLGGGPEGGSEAAAVPSA